MVDQCRFLLNCTDADVMAINSVRWSSCEPVVIVDVVSWERRRATWRATTRCDGCCECRQVIAFVQLCVTQATNADKVLPLAAASGLVDEVSRVIEKERVNKEITDAVCARLNRCSFVCF